MRKSINYSNKVLLSVLAHPDDETFGMGGTLALYAQRGADVHLVCATRGEVGEVAAEYTQSIKSVACLRTQELRCAADVLGINQLHFLNYRDSGMPGSDDNHHPKALAVQPVEKVAKEIAHLIRKIEPNVVLTFDPIGGYRHPDHIAIHQATVLGFKLASDPDFVDPQGFAPFQPHKLYFHLIERAFIKIMVGALRLIGKNPRKFGRNGDIDLVSLTKVDFPTHVKVNYRPVRTLKEKAAACHASQGGVEMNKGFRGFVTHLFAGYNDIYMQRYPEASNSLRVRRDLFSGR